MNHSYGVKTFATAYTLLYICMAAWVCVCVYMCVALIAICEHVKLYVGEGERNNSMHVIHLNNQPMQ